ncbi:MAG TPA: signal recognition particle-docking protein FtsY [Rhizobiales bacterium]|nr:signal recognition particle-docking protein FtsY [Hyphomicrobiales bacterium]
MSEGNKPSFFQRLLGLGDDKPKPEEPTPPPKKEPPSEAPQRKPPEKTPAKEEPERERLPKTANAKPAPRRKPHPAPGVSETKAKPKTSLPLEPKRSWFAELRHGLSRTSTALSDNIASVLTKRKLDEETLDRLEEVLIKADLGVAMAARMRAAIAKGRYERGLTPEAVREVLAAEIASVLEPVAQPFALSTARPHVFLVVGVNGTGKTTSIGKIAWHLREAGRTCVIGAGDTFRAAAGEQLETWAQRAGADFVSSQSGGDPAAVAFDAVSAAESRGRDVVIVDTAGRLHTQGHLMEELRKIHRVIAQRLPGAPHEVLLTIDATTGQNGLQQARLFTEAVDVTGIVLTKLDGTAKGGIALAIAHELRIPVKLIGIGEGIEDLRPFDPGDFARALFAAE